MADEKPEAKAEPKDPIVTNGVNLNLESAAVGFDGEPLKEAKSNGEEEVLTLKSLITLALSRDRKESDSTSIWALGCKIATAGESVVLDAANLELVKRIIKNDDGLTNALKGQILKALEG